MAAAESEEATSEPSAELEEAFMPETIADRDGSRMEPTMMMETRTTATSTSGLRDAGLTVRSDCSSVPISLSLFLALDAMP